MLSYLDNPEMDKLSPGAIAQAQQRKNARRGTGTGVPSLDSVQPGATAISDIPPMPTGLQAQNQRSIANAQASGPYPNLPESTFSPNNMAMDKVMGPAIPSTAIAAPARTGATSAWPQGGATGQWNQQGAAGQIRPVAPGSVPLTTTAGAPPPPAESSGEMSTGESIGRAFGALASIPGAIIGNNGLIGPNGPISTALGFGNGGAATPAADSVARAPWQLPVLAQGGPGQSDQDIAAAQAGAPSTAIATPALPPGVRDITADMDARTGPARGGMTTEQSNAYFGAQNRADRALAEQNAGKNFDANTNAMNANADWASAWTANRDAQDRARFAEGKVHLGAGGARLAAAARASADAAETAVNKAGAVPQIPRTALADVAAGQNMTNAERTTAATLARSAALDPLAAKEAQQKLDIGAITLDQHKVQQSLLTAMQNAKTPEEYKRAHMSYLAAIGKEPPKVELTHVEGATYTKPGEAFPTKEPGIAYMVDPYTHEVKTLAGTAGNTAIGSVAVPQEAIAYLKSNPDKKAEFEKKYGAGSAAQYLK